MASIPDGQTESDKIMAAMARADKQRIIAVDLDGTLAVEGQWKGYEYIGEPIWPVIEAVRREKQKGTYVTIHTCRVATVDNKIFVDSVNTLRQWLSEHEVPYDEIWLATGKPFAHEYWDDKSVPVPGLAKHEKYFSTK